MIQTQSRFESLSQAFDLQQQPGSCARDVKSLVPLPPAFFAAKNRSDSGARSGPPGRPEKDPALFDPGGLRTAIGNH